MLTRRELLIAAGALALGSWRRDKLDAILQEANRWPRDIGRRVSLAGQAFIGVAYVAHTLEVPGREQATFTLEGFDCFTLAETCLNIARLSLQAGRFEHGPTHELTRSFIRTRYRGGKVQGYESRLHYTCDWMSDNEVRGNLSLVASKLPRAVHTKKRIDFMSTHPNSYRQLQETPELVAKIAGIEKVISSAGYWELPKQHVKAAGKLLKDGDIIGIATSVAGLDCSHMGIIAVKDGVPRLLHASSAKGKVILDGPIWEYLDGSKSATGILVGRPSREL